MPTYEYSCAGCSMHLEVVQKMTEASLETCAICGGKLRKVFHPAGILFKGSGFYATDNRSKPKTSTSTGSDSAERSGDDSSGKSSEKSGDKADTSSSSAKTETKSDGKKGDSKPVKESA